MVLLHRHVADLHHVDDPLVPAAAQRPADQPFRPEIPHTWDAAKLADFELPLAPPAPRIAFPSAEYYYSIPARKPFQTYPIYAPGKEPEGYLEGLFAREPSIAFDAARLKTRQDWVSAGRVIFESGGTTAVFAADMYPTSVHVSDPWVMGYDLYPMDTLAFKRAFAREAIEREYVIFFEHDPSMAAGILREAGGRRRVERIL